MFAVFYNDNDNLVLLNHQLFLYHGLVSLVLCLFYLNHLLFLEQADVITQRLVGILDQCAQSQEPQVPEALQLDAHHMAQLAQEVSLSSVHLVADALAAQLARLRTTRIVADIQTSLQGAQEVSRLLHQFAVGNVREPQESVLAALRGD